MIASLPMYERPENAADHDRFWQAIRTHLRSSTDELPTALTRDADLWSIWQSPDLLVSQTCGLPYRTRLHETVTLLGAPDFGISDKPGFYNSVLVARRMDTRRSLEDFAGAHLAVNDAVSQSGWAAPQAHMDALGLPRFDHVLLTGSHRASALTVAQGRAEIAAIDAVTWRLMVRWDAFARDLEVIDETTPTPGLPYIAARGTNAKATLDAVHAAIATLSPEERTRLGGIQGFVPMTSDAYLSLPGAPAFPSAE